jgi:hypothetical protein
MAPDSGRQRAPVKASSFTSCSSHHVLALLVSPCSRLAVLRCSVIPSHVLSLNQHITRYVYIATPCLISFCLLSTFPTWTIDRLLGYYWNPNSEVKHRLSVLVPSLVVSVYSASDV